MLVRYKKHSKSNWIQRVRGLKTTEPQWIGNQIMS